MTLLAFLGGLVTLAAGGELLIRSSTRLATDLGVSRLFIGLTVRSRSRPSSSSR